jgi:hypothetical protein
MFMALRAHWPEYLMEVAELGMFMISACVFAAIVGLLLHRSLKRCLTLPYGAFSWALPWV